MKEHTIEGKEVMIGPERGKATYKQCTDEELNNYNIQTLKKHYSH